MKRIYQKNGCYCTYPTVTPKNWKTGGKNLLQKPWRIQFYYYDRNSEYGEKPKQIRVKGMNDCHTLIERREITEYILNIILRKLNNQYNYITESYMDASAEVDGETPFLEALKHYEKEKDVSHEYHLDLRSMLKYVEISIKALSIEYKEVQEIKRRDIRSILKHQQQTRGLSNNRYNKYKGMLSSLFDDMIEDEVIEYNPTHKIKKLHTVSNLREVLTDEQVRIVSSHLKEKFYTFYRFMMIFYASGARVAELMNIQIKDVDLSKLEYRVMVKKGGQFKWVIKPINEEVAYLWNEVINEKVRGKVEIKPNLYLFGKNLQKNEVKIHPSQITRRWKVHVKEKLGITVDFYAFKHLYSDRVAAQLDLNHVAKMNSHTTNRMAKKHYAVGEEQRKLERLKKVSIPLIQEKEGLKVV